MENKESNNRVNEITGLRNHFTYIIEEAWKTIVAFAAFFLLSDISVELIKELQVGNWVMVVIILAVVAAIFLLIILFFVNRWRKTFISVKDGMLTVERKLIMHYRNEIALDNISNINLEQNIFEMVVGTYKLKLDTNSSSTADKTDVKIVLKADMAYKVKNTIMEMMREAHQEVVGEVSPEDMMAVNMANVQDMINAPNTGNALNEQRALFEPDIMGDIAENDYDIIYDNKTIIRNCIAKTSIMAVLIVIALFIGLAVQISDIITTGESVGTAIITAFAAIILNMSVLRALVNSWLNDFRFRVKRHKDKIYVSCGLLKKKKYAIPVNMVNAVNIYANFLGRLMKLYCVEIISVGGEQEESQGKAVLLAGKMADLKEKLAIILPEYELPEIENVSKMPKRVLWCRLIKGTVFFAAVAAIVYFAAEPLYKFMNDGQQAGFTDKERMRYIVPFLCGIGGCLVMFYFFAILTYCQRGLYLGESDLVITRGCFDKRILTIPYEKIQNINYTQGIIERMLNVGSGCIFILATLAFKAHSTGKYDMETYEKLNEKLRETY